MTGFAASDALATPFQISWELRSVNHRFLDIGFRLPEEFRSLESAFRERVAAVLKRGKVDCTLKLTVQSGHSGAAEIDTDALRALARLQAAVRDELPDAQPLSTAELLRWPGVIGGPGAFVVAAERYETFGEAILKKLIAEIAGRQPPRSARLRH
jgi:uncharacterized protein (TIGR00255 family)